MSSETLDLTRLSERYKRFAIEEAQGSSDIYESLALAIAASPEILSFIATLPAERQQPNLFLAAVRHLFGVPTDESYLHDIVRNNQPSLRELMLTRTTQTNEPARCAVMLPILASLPQPLALLEVGASAGLCLLPDRYRYDYGSVSLQPKDDVGASPPTFPCRISSRVPIPTTLPSVAWRRGLDLNPIDLRVTEDVSWLETLVWPGQEARAARLRAAIEIARVEPPRVVRGDLLSDLEPLMASAPKEVTLVVFHTAVLGYVSDRSKRDQFEVTLRDSRAIWISNESPRVFAAIREMAPAPRSSGQFLLSINGQPVAWTGPHGQSIDWFGS